MSNSITRDESGQYTLNGVFSPDELLGIAEDVLRQRMERVGQTLEDPAQANRFLRMAIGGLPYEVFAVLFLDSRHRILGTGYMRDGAGGHCRQTPTSALHDSGALLTCPIVLFYGAYHVTLTARVPPIERIIHAPIRRLRAHRCFRRRCV